MRINTSSSATVDSAFRRGSGITDLGELFGKKVDDDDVDTVLGLMARLNLVPIPGSVVRWEGLELIAERAAGRRHTIETVLVQQVDDDDESSDTDPGTEAATQLAVDAAERIS